LPGSGLDAIEPHFPLLPDLVDKPIALTFGNMVFGAVLEGRTGLMSALLKGRTVPIPERPS
jgi:hypothetical protein